RRPPAPGDGRVDGLHAQLALGGAVSRDDGWRRRARVHPDADRWAEPHVAQDDHRRHQDRSRVAERRLYAPAPRPPGGTPALIHGGVAAPPAPPHTNNTR